MVAQGIVTTATARNGVGSFILQCKRLDLLYSQHGGSSRGMNAFLTSSAFARFARANPSIEIQISPRKGYKHPIVTGHYMNGREKAICVRSLDEKQIMQKMTLLMEASGERNRKIRGKNVVSTNESVRGIWSPFHLNESHQASAKTIS